MTVRRIEAQVEATSLRHVRIFRDDLIAIARALLEVGPLVGSCGDLQFDDPTDFERMAGQLPEHLPALTMVAVAPDRGGQPEASRVEIVLSPDMARVTLTEPVTLTLGVRDRVMRIAAHGERRVINVLGSSGAMRRYLGWLALAFLVWWVIELPTAAAHLVHNVGLLLSHGRIPSGKSILLLIGLIIAVSLLLVGASRLPGTSSSAVVINVPRASRPSFWVRKRDDIKIAIVSLVAGGVVGYFVNVLTSGSRR